VVAGVGGGGGGGRGFGGEGGAAPVRVRGDDVHGHASGLRVLRRHARHDALAGPAQRRRRPRRDRVARRPAKLGPGAVSHPPPLILSVPIRAPRRSPLPVGACSAP
jgi:transposase InsO family protein